MSWTVIGLLIALAIFIQWRQSKGAEKSANANARIERDTRLYERIKEGMREYHWREREKPFWEAKDRELLFETAHMVAWHVDHFAESRVGFYFKDLEEYGLYGGFAGNGDEFHESFYRSDRDFNLEERLMTWED